jgi:hypothetical protein
MRPWRSLTALVLVAFALTGCMRLDMDLSINGENDTLSGSFVVAMDKGVLTLNGKTPEQGFADTEKSLKDVPQGTRSEIFDDGKYYGRKIIFDGYPIAEFNRQNSTSSITHRDGKYIFAMDGTTPVKNVSSPEWMNALANIEINISVTFPGKVIEHDAQSTLHERTVTWKLKLTEFKQIRAVAQDKKQGFPWVLLAIVTGIFGVLVVAGIVVLALRLNRRQPPPVPGD